MAREPNDREEALRLIGSASLLTFGMGIGAVRGYLVLFEGEPAGDSAFGVAANVLFPLLCTLAGVWLLKRERVRSR